MNALLLGILVIGACVGFACAGVLLVRRAMRGRVLEGHNDVLAPMFATAGVIYAVLLGFLVIAVWQSYDDAKANVSDESTLLTTAYRLTTGMRHPEERMMVRAALREYTQAVIEDEWKTQSRDGTASQAARAAVGKMYAAFHIMPLEQSGSQINGEFLHTISAITLDRNRRVVQAGESLAWVMWLGLILGGVCVVGMTFILYMEAAWPHVLVSSVLAALIGTMLYVAIVLNRPFQGPLAITFEPFEYAVSLYDSVDRGE